MEKAFGNFKINYEMLIDFKVAENVFVQMNAHHGLVWTCFSPEIRIDDE